MAKKKSKEWILDHYECEGQLSIDDLPFTDKNVDNYVIFNEFIIFYA